MNEENLEYDLGEIELPKNGDIPIKQGGFHLYAKSDWNARAWGFKKAADILTNHIQKSIIYGDLVVYPIVYLYRHHLELSLKDIIIRGNYLLDKPITLKFDHSLNKLWNYCQTILPQIGIPTDIPEAKPFKDCLKQLDQVDSQANAFRYPVTKNEKPTLLNLDSVDLNNLRIVIDRMSFFIEIISDMLAEKLGDTWGI